MDILRTLNNKQKEAVCCIDGPLLVIAGAGSGKTRVIIHRILNLIQEGVRPYNIMAITFTNKAAGEMRERLKKYSYNENNNFGDVWIATFHSSCVRILRVHINKLGYDNSFTIYDRDDQKSLVKSILKMTEFKDCGIGEKEIINFISNSKNNNIKPSDLSEADGYFADIYDAYEKKMKSNNALDFDDLLLKTVELLQTYPKVKEYYNNLFKYIMVDEYQDTNAVQFKLISLLCNKENNICVVGDDDQSIYAFRGADISNILDFEKHFPGAKVVKLEQNYRSNKNIIKCANAVISNNKNRKDKTLWSDIDENNKIRYKEYDNEELEARDIAEEIKNECTKGTYNYSQYAVLYRTNAQSRLIEKELFKNGIPYTLVGGVNFYQRKEIKDIIAYLRLIINPMDDVSFLRVVNIPKRGIGKAALDKLQDFADENNISLLGASRYADKISGLRSGVLKLKEFENIIQLFRNNCIIDDSDIDNKSMNIIDVINYIVDKIGYREHLQKEGESEANLRLENIEELINAASAYNDIGLRAFIEEVSLYSSSDEYSSDSEKVNIMTLHSAKGLEFNNVYIIGMEQGVFPSLKTFDKFDEEFIDYDSLYDDKEIEEERRLCYVGITRAKNILRISSNITKKVYGRDKRYMPSMFIKEMPLDVIDANNYSLRRAGFVVGSDRYVNDMNSKAQLVNEDKAVYKSSFHNRQKPQNFGKSIDQLVKREGDIGYIPKVGEKVKHFKFGIGEVIDIKKILNDYEAAIEFESSGKRILRLSFAKLSKI